METFTAYVEVDRDGPLAVDQIDSVMAKLKPYHAALVGSPRGWLAAHVTLPAESLIQACADATNLVAAAFDAKAIVCEVMPEREFLRR